ncbi:MAG: hypothetical protein ACTSP4_17635 [Candidatus Hodarchaeales archaeon]
MKADIPKTESKPAIPRKKVERKIETPRAAPDTRKEIEKSQATPKEPVKKAEIKPEPLPPEAPAQSAVKELVKKSAVDKIAELKKKRPRDQDEL